MFRGGNSSGFGAQPRGGSRGGRGGGRGFGGFRGGASGAPFRGGRGGAPMRGGRGGFQPAVPQNTRAVFDDEAPPRTAPVVEVPAARTHLGTHTTVQTVVNDHGSEVPQRLNNKVFVDGLPYEYVPEPGKASLEEELSQFVQDWKVGKVMRLIKRDGQGFGYLAFRSPNSVDVAVRVLNGRKFLGRALRVEMPKPKDLERMDEVASMRDHGKTSFARQVLLSDLSKSAQPEIIREILRDIAPQLEEKIETIKMTSNNRKAFLTLKSEGDVDPAVTFLNGYSMLGRNICAQRALAPGSLPFSKVTTPMARNAGGMADPFGAQNTKSMFEDDEDEDAMLVPLGSSVASAASKTTPVATQSKIQANKAPAVGASGKTSKYDLLDKGPSEVYVGNLPEDASVESLKKHFGLCGGIKTCEILVNPATRHPTGIARIEFAIPAYAKYAQENLHGSRMGGSTIRVDRGDEANEEPVGATTVVSMNDDDEIDEDAYLKHHGIRNKEAYFRGTSVADPAAESAPASSKTVKKGKRPRGEEMMGLPNPIRNQTHGVVHGSSMDEDDDDEGGLPFGDDDDDDDEAFDDVDAPKRASKAPSTGNAKRSNAGAPKKKKTGKPSRHSNTVDF